MRIIGLILVVLITGCGGDEKTEDSDAIFIPIGQVDAMITIDAGTARRLSLRFEPIEQDSGALRLTDLAFLPSPPGDFILIDKDGDVIHMRMEGDGARRLGGFTIDDTWFDSDCGLISVAVEPDFEQNPYIYLGLCASKESNTIRRYTWDPSDYEAIKASAREVITVRGPRAPRSWHNVGSIGFTEEGYLWALFGDKVLNEPALDPNSALGALLRIIPNREPDGDGYTTPDDNPFADGSGHPAVYAKGMRSPWKGIYIDGQWFFGDIGLDTFEEINRVDMPGQVFGWPAAEGLCQKDCDGMTDPWAHYGRGSGPAYVREDLDSSTAKLRSVWIGWSYQANERDPYDGLWNGILTFGDFYAGFIRAAPIDGDGASWHAGHLTGSTAWRQGPDGYVYVTALGTWPVDAPTTLSPIYRVYLAQ